MNQTFLTVDLGFGDAGKGSIVDYLTREHTAHTVVRYNGGAQAAHRVVTDETPAREHVFAQFGAGTLAGAATHLSRFMLLDPLAMEQEADHLRALGVADPFATLTIDERALVITPYARAINRLRELARGAGRHGSCGMGIGETALDALHHGERALFAGDLANPDRLAAKLAFLRDVALAKLRGFRHELLDAPETARELAPLLDDDWLDWTIESYRTFAGLARTVPAEHLHALLRRPGCVVFEGAQGVLLDEWRGFHPYTTWSTTTLERADTLLREAGYAGDVRRIGIARAYATRHGAGPLVSEDPALSAILPDARNLTHPWQQHFRVGPLDLVALRYATAAVGRLDSIALTCLDRLAELPSIALCDSYLCDGERIERLPLNPSREDLVWQGALTERLAHCQPILEKVADEGELIARVERALGAPVTITSWGPTAAAKRTMQA